MSHAKPQSDPAPIPVKEERHQERRRQHQEDISKNQEEQRANHQHNDLQVVERGAFRFQPE